jgi:peptidoglycan hydrolase CwlO-like protein
MNKNVWIAIAVAALVVGVLLGYGVWGPDAGRVPEMEKDLKAAQALVEKTKKEIADLKGNLGDVTNQKLNLEKENADLKEALEKASKRKGR